MALVLGVLARNEATRFLPSALGAWGEFADRIVLLDDDSEDATAEVAEAAGARVYRRGAGVSAWGEEAPARAELFERLMQESEAGDWLFVLDADMTPARDPRDLFKFAGDAVAFRLFDLWAEDKEGVLYYRNDAFWQAHYHHRVWAIRRPNQPPSDGWLWSPRGVHTGHFPLNLAARTCLYAPVDYSLLHYAYADPSLREAKHAQYTSVAAQLSPQEQAHAASILDERPSLMPLPMRPTLRLSL